MAVISDINPNSLGPLQPIRAPQVPISIPNPLSVAPFFQGQQLQQNERRLDQQDIAMALQEKQFDLQMSELMFRQTKEILDMGDMDAEDAYNQHTSRQSQGSGKDYGSQLGLNPEYPAHKMLIDKANAQIGDFQSKLSSAMSGVLKGGDPKAITQLYADMKGGLMKSRQSIQNDPEYMKYAVQQQKYDRFVKGTAAEIAKGNSVDNIQRRRTEELYKRFASGDHLTLRETQELEAMLSDSNIQEISFNQTKGREWLKATIENAAKPINEEEGIDTNDPRLPGYGIVKHTKTYADPAEVMHQTVAAAATNVDLVKMFKATTGLDIRDKKNYGAFANFIATQAKPYIHEGGKFTTDIGAAIVDPTEVLKAKAAAAGGARGAAAQNPYGSDSEGVRAQLYEDSFSQDGLEPAAGYGRADIFEYSRLKAAGKTVQEIDDKTGEIKVWRIKVDSDGNPEMEPDIDPKTDKVIPNSDHVVKIGDPILILQKRSSGIEAPQGGIQYQQGAVDTSVGKAVPTFQPGQLDTYRSRVASAYEKGEQNPIVRTSENASQDSMSVDPQGARGRYQFYGVHQTEFLKSLGESDWKTAYSKLGPEEFAKKEDEYFNNKVKKPAVDYFNTTLGLPPQPDSDLTDVGRVVYDYIGSTANQSSAQGWKVILDDAISKIKAAPLESVDPAMMLEELYKARVKYITELPQKVKQESPYYKKGKWHEIAVNRPYQDYVAAVDRLNVLTGKSPQELQGTESFVTHTSDPIATVGDPKATPTSASGVSAPTPQQAQTQMAVEDANLHPAIKTVQGIYLRGERPSPAKLMEYINEAGLVTPDRETTNPSQAAKIAGVTTSGPSIISKANETLQRAENALRVVESKIKEDSKASQRKGTGVINPETDPRYIKAANDVNAALTSRNALADKYFPEAEALVLAEAFPTEAKESYTVAAQLLADTIGTTTQFDLDLINPELEGTIIEYEDDPGVFSLQEKGKKERDITLAELAEWIEDNAKPFAFSQTDPVELRRAKIAKVKAAVVQQPAAPATPAKKTGTGIDW